uniref:Uncharacterized protein n=1 Tax=Mola mola TaxID=94237 RepID=A0A3Q4AZ71_MOLML
ILEPPTNVTLHCHNLDNIVEWTYSHLVPGIRFRVDIRTLSPKVIWVDPPILQANISLMSDPTDANYLTVTAVNERNESDFAPPEGITFSYFMGSPATQKCFLAFPAVNVTADTDDHVLFHFMHPWMLYHKKLLSSLSTKPRKKKSHDTNIEIPLPEFMYDIDVINQHTPERFTCETSVCKGKLAVALAQKKYCLKFTGEMQKMSVQATQDYCTLPLQEMPQNVVSPLALMAFVLVLYMVFKKKTRPSSSLPSSTTFSGQRKHWTLGVAKEPVLVAVVEPSSPTPLISPTEEKAGKEFTSSMTSSTDPDLRLPIGVLTEDESICDFGQAVNDESPGYMQGGKLEDDDTQPCIGSSSGYEKRPVLVELAPDELAEGYRS